MIALIRCLALLLLSAPLWAFEPDRHAWYWPLEPETDSPVHRVALTPEIYSQLVGPDLAELVVTDAEGQPVPFALLSDSDLTEPLVDRLELNFESESYATDADSETPGSPLEITLDHGETRLVLSDSPRAGRERERLVFEALIAAAEMPDAMSQHHLLLRFSSRQPADPECRLRNAENDQAKESVLPIADEGDRHPYRYTASHAFDQPPRAWHLLCFAESLPEGFALDEARLELRGKRDHSGRHRLRPELQRIDPGWRFDLPGPMEVLAVSVRSRRNHELADLQLASRSGTDQSWRRRATGVLSTIEGSGTPARIRPDAIDDRHRQWLLRSEPPMREAPDVVVEVEAEELAFLAQGPGPWRLYGGSHRRDVGVRPERLVARTRASMGPPWRWPQVRPGGRQTAGGHDALSPPEQPIPWQRYLLWGVLIAGAGLLVVLSIRLLRQE